MTAPIIVTALMGDEDHALYDGLRCAHFPPERNMIPAHLTLFHHLPPSTLDELCQRLAHEARGPAPAARTAGLMDLGGGTAIRIRSAGLGNVRDRLADAFHDLLVPQDRAGWRPHVTIQNKVARAAAQALQSELGSAYADRPVRIAGLACWWYRGGPWEPITACRFRG